MAKGDPPQDIDAEVKFLGCLLVIPSLYGEDARTLGQRDFWRPAHGIIFKAIMELGRRGEPVAPVTVKSYLEDADRLGECGGFAYLMSLVKAAEEDQHLGSWFARRVREKAEERRALSLSAEVQSLIHKGELEEAAALLGRAQARRLHGIGGVPL